MMKNPAAANVFDQMKRFRDAGINLRAQIVLCPDWNDGEELDRTLNDLAEMFPAVNSISVVPVGVTKYREGLFPLEACTPEECAAVIRQVDSFGADCLQKYGTRLFYCSDEFYVRAGLPLPNEDFYEDYSQIENGVRMLTSLESEFDFELDYLHELLPQMRAPRTVSIATGAAAYEHIRNMAERLTALVPNLTVHVYRIVNRFFGESVTVAGLLTGKDVAEQLKDMPLGDELLFPAVMLRADGDVFLDDMTPEQLSKRLGVPVCASESDGAKLIRAILGVPMN
jgi:putative radical SAM enzyme (TIGR03279 family)